MPSSRPPSPTPSAPTHYHHARLPRLDIPKFSGSPAEWLSFRDLFSSLIIANPTLSPVEKLQYLKNSLIGTAAHLLTNTALTDANFQPAWEALIAFYENKRLLVHTALHSLMTMKKMAKDSAQELEALYTTTQELCSKH